MHEKVGPHWTRKIQRALYHRGADQPSANHHLSKATNLQTYPSLHQHPARHPNCLSRLGNALTETRLWYSGQNYRLLGPGQIPLKLYTYRAL